MYRDVLRILGRRSASTTNREEGFVAAIKTHPEMHVVSENRRGGVTTESAFATSENLLSAQKAASGGVDGIFTPNESTTFGMLLAIRKAGLGRKMKFVGFDSSEKLKGALQEGDLDGLVLQDPFNMGYLAVKTLSAVIRGEKVEKRIDTGARMVTKANMGQPEMKELLEPDLKKWLKE